MRILDSERPELQTSLEEKELDFLDELLLKDWSDRFEADEIVRILRLKASCSSYSFSVIY